MKKIKYLIVLVSLFVIGTRLFGGIVHADTETCNHVFGDWVIEQESTCISKGVRYHTCTICGRTEQEVTEYSSHEYVQTISKPQTETEHGEFTYTCNFCGHVKVTTMAHVPGDWSDPGISCTEVLISVRKCTICNVEIDSKEIAPAGHDLINHPEVSPTCHTFGNISYDTCSRCDYTTLALIPPEDHFIGENIIYKSTTSYLTLEDIKSILTKDLITCNCKLRYEVEDVNYIGKGNISGTYFVNFYIYNDSLENPDYIETHLINIIVNPNLKSDYVYKNNFYFRAKINAESIVSDLKYLKKVPNVNLATEFRLKNDTKVSWSDVSKIGTYTYDISYIASSGESGTIGVNLNFLAPLVTTTNDNTSNSNFKKIITFIILILIIVMIIYLIYILIFKKKRYWRKRK